MSDIDVQDYWDEEYDECDDDFDIEDALEECGQHGTGAFSCQKAGTEYCDFECPYRDVDLGFINP